MMAHLYPASRLLDPEAPAWPDMEYLLYQQGSEGLSIGGLPRTLDESHRKCNVAVGQSTLGFGKNNTYQELKTTRPIIDTSLLSPIFTNRSFGWATTTASADDLVKRLNNTSRSPKYLLTLARQLNKNPDFVKSELKVDRARPF
jgi:hypothetical protein